MKQKAKDFFYIGKNFKKEFKKQIRMLILITIGFTIAFTWRQTIFDISQSFINFFLDLNSSAILSIITSIFITLLGLVLILFTSHWLKNNLNDKY